MTAPVFLAESLESVTAGAVLTLDGDEARHAARVRRVQPGERIDVVDGQGRRARTTITSVSGSGRATIDCEVTDVVTEPAPTRRIIVIQALAKGERSERAVETLTEVGADVIVPWAAERSVTVWSPPRAERGVQRWRATAREAMKQSRRAWQPIVADLADLTEVRRWVEQAGSAFLLDAEGDPLPMILDEDSGRHDRRDGDWVVIVGPEGGVTDAETAALLAAGARRTSLGPTILRTSTAGTVATAVIAAGHRWSASPARSGGSVTGSCP